MIALIAQADELALRKINRAEAHSYMEMIDQSYVHPLALLIFVLAAIWIFVGPSNKITWSVIAIACLVSVAQRISVLTLDFDFIRAIGTLGLIRILVYGELRTIKPNLGDKLILGYVTTLIGCSLINGGLSEATTRGGLCLSYFSIYWIGRSSIRTVQDLKLMLTFIGVVLIPVAIFMTIEKLTGRNYFSIFGGISTLTAMRDGKLRAQGGFTHPIIAGVFFAGLAPIAFGVILSKAKGLPSLLAGWITLILSLVVILMTASSTPVAGFLIGVMSWCTFKIRWHLKTYLYVLGFMAVVVHFVANNGLHGVLFTKIDFTGSSTGYHRYMLVQGMLDNIPNWVVTGSPGAKYNKAFRDITNMYVLSALTGGLLALVLQIMMVIQALKGCVASVRKAITRQDLVISYGLGCGLVVMIASFTAVSCYGEGIVPFYLLVGGAISLGQVLPSKGSVRPSKSPETKRPAHIQHSQTSRKIRPDAPLG